MHESRLKSSVALRMFIIAVLTPLLLIPTLFVQILIDERSERRNAAAQEVSESWGGMQTLAGPILTIPFRHATKTEKGESAVETRYAHFLPSALTIRGTLNPEIRYRGIYEVALYRGDFQIDGAFAAPDLDALHIAPESVLWEEAVLTLGITDLRGIREPVSIRWNDLPYPSEPGVGSGGVLASGVTFTPRLVRNPAAYRFSLPLALNGSSEVRFVPSGAVTTVRLEASWGNPSFVGGFLPHTRTITPDSFAAEWKVVSVNRNIPQAWIGFDREILATSFGTTLYLPVDEYQKTSRSVKYAILFIGLTFVAFFLSELIVKTAFHPIQYILIGFALVLFYVLLLSLSEHLGFNVAYFAASGATIALVTTYASWIAARRQIAAVVFLVLLALYGFLYVTLQLQDYALLLGSIGLFVVLLAIMTLTRRIDWFSVNQP